MPAQDQRKADSLKQVLQSSDALSPLSKLKLISAISTFSAAPQDKLLYADLLLDLAQQAGSGEYRAKAYQFKGVALRRSGNLKQSIEHLFLSLGEAIDGNHIDLQVEAYIEIANTYISNNDFKNALAHQKKAIEIIRLHGNKEQLAINLLNTGFVYYTINLLDSALLFYNEAEPIFDAIGLEIGKAYNLGNRALVYWKSGDHSTAEQDLLKTIAMLEPLGDQFGMADYHNQLGSIYLEQENIESAIYHTTKALVMAEVLDLKQQIRDASRLLSELHEKKGNFQKALIYQKEYIAYKDSIENAESTRTIADLRTAFEVSLKEKEIDLLENRQSLQRTYIIIAVILLLLSIVLILFFRQRFFTAKLMANNERREHSEKIKDLLTAQETKTLQAMVEGRDHERKRLAQELHNHFGSLLATVKVNLNGIDKGAIHNHHILTTLIDQACADVRNMSHSLNMGISENFGLIPALKELTTYLCESGEVEVELSASRCEGSLDFESQIMVYRIVQELLSNSLKHADARFLSVSLTFFEEERLISIVVHDDGVGFDPGKIEQPGTEGMGLESLMKMIKNKDGEIIFDAQPGKGTTVTVDLPISVNTDLI